MAIEFKSFTEGQQQDTNPNRQWWKLKKEDIPASIQAILGFLQQHQGSRQTQMVISSRLYGNQNVMGVNGLSYSKVASTFSQLKDRISYNVCQSVVDTVTSKMAKNKPRPYFLTSGGDYKIQRKAKKLGKFVDGLFYENEMYALGTQIFKDACVWGSGAVKVFPSSGRVKVERALVAELYVDEVEGFYGYPRQLHQVRNVDRQVLMDEFPAYKAKILQAKRAIPDSRSMDNISDQVTVAESWHLRSGPEAKDGLHVIVIENATLHSEQWDKDYFPFAFFHWTKRMHGFWGQGLIEQIQNIQLEINKLLWVIQRSMHLMGSFKVLLENGSKVVKAHIDNDIGTIINYTGTQPTYVTPPIVAPEVYAHLMTLKNAAYEQAGISQLSAASKKPDGLNSGKALREFNDIESDRFMTVGQSYERFYLDVAKLGIDCARGLYEEDEAYEVKVPGKKFIETIKWSEVDLEEDEYVMKCYPVSSLPNDPAGRLQTVQEYAQAGFLSPREARRLLDFPDLEQIENLANAQEGRIHEILEGILDWDGEGESPYESPEPYLNLDLCQELALQYYAEGLCSKLEEEKLDLIRQFIDQANMLKEKAMQPPASAMGAPQAVPQAPPQSDLISNNPAMAAAPGGQAA